MWTSFYQSSLCPLLFCGHHHTSSSAFFIVTILFISIYTAHFTQTKRVPLLNYDAHIQSESQRRSHTTESLQQSTTYLQSLSVYPYTYSSTGLPKELAQCEKKTSLPSPPLLLEICGNRTRAGHYTPHQSRRLALCS